MAERSVQLSFRTPSELRTRFLDAAKDAALSPSDYLRVALDSMDPACLDRQKEVDALKSQLVEQLRRHDSTIGDWSRAEAKMTRNMDDLRDRLAESELMVGQLQARIRELESAAPPPASGGHLVDFMEDGPKEGALEERLLMETAERNATAPAELIKNVFLCWLVDRRPDMRRVYSRSQIISMLQQ